MRKFALFIVTIALMVSLTGCEKESFVVDWSPVNIYLKVTDGKGTDFLDPENPNNMIDGTTITFKGETYEAKRDDEYLYRETKAYLARMHGLRLAKDSRIFNGIDQGYSLMFGQIDGAEDMDEDLLVTLSDGTTGTIHYHCSNHNERKLRCDRSWKFNGAKVEGNIFTFVVSD